MNPSSEGEPGASRAAERGHGMLRIMLLGVVAVMAVAVATARPWPVAPVGEEAFAAVCVEPSLALPPGHPPVRGVGPAGPGVALPPGHPRLDGPVRRAPRLPGLAPSFEAPAVVEI